MSSSYKCSMSDIRAPKRRTACDRCRRQKLRCLRIDGHPTFSCIRCVRSQVECMTSSSKRPGRPTKNVMNVPWELADPIPDGYGDVSASVDTTDFDDWFNSGSLDASYETSSACCPSVDWGEIHSPMHGGGSAFTMSSLSSPTNGSLNSTLLDGLTETTPSDRYSSLQSEQGHLVALQALENQPSTQNYDGGFRLSILYRELSKQLFILKSMPWDMKEVMRLTCIHDGHGNLAKAFQANFESNPLAGIAKWSAEFTEILETFQTAISSQYGNTTANTDMLSSVRLCLSVNDILGIVSCHMLVVSIYDSIFYHFIDQCIHNPGAVKIVMQSAPKLFLGGVAITPWPDMPSHVLCYLVKSQLRPIELLLGIPDEFCVTLQRGPINKDREEGLLGGHSSQSFFAALMQVETDQVAGGMYGKGVIESLREKMRRVQILN